MAPSSRQPSVIAVGQVAVSWGCWLLKTVPHNPSQRALQVLFAL